MFLQISYILESSFKSLLISVILFINVDLSFFHLLSLSSVVYLALRQSVNSNHPDASLLFRSGVFANSIVLPEN